MKILFLIDNLGSGGAQRQLTTIASLLKKQGEQVDVLCYGQSNFFDDLLNNAGVKITRIDNCGYLKRIIRVRRFIRSGSYDAVVSFLRTPDFLNCVAAIGGRTWKVITSERSANESEFRKPRERLFSKFRRYSDAIVCNSENARNMWLKYYSKFASKLEVIYNAVTLPPINSNYTMREGGKTHILVAASYQDIKNPLNVIEAINQLEPQVREKLKLNWYGNKNVTIGDTDTYRQADLLVEKYHLQNIISLNSHSREITQYMNSSDVVALFSRFEGLPNAICEAMTIGKPIIMSKVSDYRVLVDESNGALCDWHSVESIKDAITKIVNASAQTLLSMGEESHSKSNDLFHETSVYKQWQRLLNN